MPNNSSLDKIFYGIPIKFDKKGNKISKPKIQKKEKNMKRVKRLVQVIVVDPDPKVPDEKSILHYSNEFLTSKTDEELKFELDLKTLLETHNKVRKAIEDEVASDKRNKTVYLKPVRISDLVIEVFENFEFSF